LRKKARAILGITFSFKGMTAFVGDVPQKFDYARKNNPFVNYVDQVSDKTIVFAAISPDYYLLDYHSWVRCLSTNRWNPFTRLRMTLQDLTLVTFDNIMDHYEKIVNLEQCRPPNPEDDIFRKFLESLAIITPRE
jgi:hypothetical protein